MAKKFYAVKVGKTTGIFETWDECKKNVDGYSGAIYKSFNTIEDAHVFLSDIDFTKNNDSIIQDTFCKKINSNSPTEAVAYVDGSFNIDTEQFGYGVVFFHNGEEIHLSDSFNNKDMASMRNVAGEIYGSMAAMEYAIKHEITSLSIFYDYMGISKWCTGEWKANKPGTIAYKNFYNKVKERLTVNFQKVKGHSGDKYNDLADILAKKACGVI